MMREPKIHFLVVLGTVLLFLICSVAPASAANISSTSVSNPYITIHPIGNHTIGEVFFINGTTNLPVSETLYIDVHSATESRHRLKNVYIEYGFQLESVSIIPEENGINYWSANVTEGTWKPDEYFVSVGTKKMIPCDYFPGCMKNEVEDTQVFYMVNQENAIFTTNITPPQVNNLTSIPSSPVQTHTSIVYHPSPTQHVTPFPVILLIIMLVGIVTLRSFKREKRE